MGHLQLLLILITAVERGSTSTSALLVLGEELRYLDGQVLLPALIRVIVSLHFSFPNTMSFRSLIGLQPQVFHPACQWFSGAEAVLAPTGASVLLRYCLGLRLLGNDQFTEHAVALEDCLDP